MNAKNTCGPHNPLSHLSPEVMWLPPSHVLKGISSLEAIDGLCPQEVQACLQKILQDWQQRLPDERKNSTGNTISCRNEYYQLFLNTLFARSDEVQKGALKVLWCLLQEPQVRVRASTASLNIANSALGAKNIQSFLLSNTSITKTLLQKKPILSPMHLNQVLADIRCMWLQYALLIFGKDQAMMAIAKRLGFSNNPSHVRKIIRSRFGGDAKEYIAALVNTDVPGDVVVPKNVQDALGVYDEVQVPTGSRSILLGETYLPNKAAPQHSPSSKGAGAQPESYPDSHLVSGSVPEPTRGMVDGPSTDYPGAYPRGEAIERALERLRSGGVSGEPVRTDE